MVLGVDWLRVYSPILFDFVKLKLSFKKEERMIELKGVVNEVRLQEIMATKAYKSLKKAVSGFDGQFFAIEVVEAAVDDEKDPVVEALLKEFHMVFAESTQLSPVRNLDHKIPLFPGAKSVNIRPYRSFLIQKEEIERLVKDMLKNGIIQHSSSSFASPVLLVKKKYNTWRFCIDYGHLNSLTVQNKLPISLVDELLNELHGSRFFSKLDIRSAYHQVRMFEADVEKTAFRTHHGHYEFKVMPFGLTNAPTTFQTLINNVLEPNLRKFILVFFYVILVYSSTLELHISHLKLVLEQLKNNQLFPKRSKCSFCKRQVEYLGHIISKKEVTIDPKKTEAVKDWPVPSAIKELRGFLSLAGYYRKFIQGFGMISKPLTDLLKKNSFVWNNKAQDAFDKLKVALSTAPVVALPDFDKVFVLETDACSSGLEAVLSQEGRPLAYFSKALSLRHLRLLIYKAKYMAILMAVERWRHYLEHNQFIIKTDHERLKFLLEQKIHTPIQKKGLTMLIGLRYQIHYKKGKENVTTDALSRIFEDE